MTITIAELVAYHQPNIAAILVAIAQQAREPEQHEFGWWKREMESVPGYDRQNVRHSTPWLKPGACN